MKATKTNERGRLKIGDDWNAIRIIALSQSNPLKAIAEFVENSIDANAKTIRITRGREHGAHYLAIKDDGNGVPRDADGLPDFKYVATHICDSIKRRLRADGNGMGLQGEFGIGLLSFWTVGDILTMTSIGADQRTYQMTMRKGDPRYEVSPRRVLFAEKGTELRISPLLEGIRTLSGEKIQWYLASELRDRIKDAHVRVTVIDKLARKRYEVEPRKFEGRLLHRLPLIRAPYGDAYAELYLAEPADSSRVALTRSGTRVIEDLASLPGLDHAPWRKFRALPRDRSRRRVHEDLRFNWEILEGDGSLQGVGDQEVEYRAPAIPGLARLRVTVIQRETACSAEALVTITDSLEVAMGSAVITTRGLPGYTFERAAGELWRCRFDTERNIIMVNSGHRDFVFATRNRALQLRYLARLYVKELVLKNFAGLPADQLLERMIELSLYAEEKLKSG